MQYGESDSSAILEQGHKPVLKREAVSLLAPKDGETYLDCTFGGGGHTRAILEAADCKVVALDRDPAAAGRAEKLKEEFGGRFEFVLSDFANLGKLRTGGYAGVLFDFGVSSFQLDDASRGFSFLRDGNMDMRMNPNDGAGALELILNTDEFELGNLISRYGEERKFRKAARALKYAAESGARTTVEFAEALKSAMPSNEKIHPATRTFQALRIAVNDEIGQIESALPSAFSSLKSGGVLAAISFHSLEDRIVKRFFKRIAGLPEDRFDRSSVQDRQKLGEILTKKPERPSEQEILSNPRARSAKLRAIKKL